MKERPAQAAPSVILSGEDASVMQAAPAAASAPVSEAAVDGDYQAIDYFDFENYFRGSKDAIKENQKQYVPYFEGKKNVLIGLRPRRIPGAFKGARHRRDRCGFL